MMSKINRRDKKDSHMYMIQPDTNQYKNFTNHKFLKRISIAKMGMLDCCQCLSFFGIFFYIAMGLIILGQSQFLKFRPEDKSNSAGACFVAALIEFLIVVAITLYSKWKNNSQTQKENYFDFRSEREVRKEHSFKEIAMGDLKLMREGENSARF